MKNAVSNPWVWALLAIGVLNLVLLPGTTGFTFAVGLVAGLAAIVVGIIEFVRTWRSDQAR